jgi:Holliday junction resolvasome RuvABC DNA-binding subunit
LYNLVNYVKTSREKQIKDKDIEESLKKVGWTPEQIRYVMRKFEGKNTGMPEIPIKKILKEKEK